MKVAVISEAAPSMKESGQAAGTQSNPGEFSLAMAAVLALLQTNPVNLPSAENGGGGEALPAEANCKSCLTPTPLPGAAPETSMYSFLQQDPAATVETDSISDIKKSVEQLPYPKTPMELNPALENSVKEGTAVTGPVGGGVPGGAEPTGAEPAGAEPTGAEPAGAEPTGAAKEPVAFSGNAGGSLFEEAKKDNVLNSKKVDSSVVSAKVDSSVVSAKIDSSVVSAKIDSSTATAKEVNSSTASAVIKEIAPRVENNCVPPEGSMTGKTAFVPQKESAAIQAAVFGENSSTPGNSGMAVIQEKSGVKAVVHEQMNSLRTDSPDKIEVEVKTDSGEFNKKSMENNLNTTQVNVITPASTSGENSVTLTGLRERLVQEIKHMYNNHKDEPLTQVQLKLEPEHLGRLTIKLFFSKGELDAHFYTGSGYVKDVLEGSIQQLRESLGLQDLKLNQAFVFVGDDGRSGTGQSESGSRQASPFPGSYSGRTYREAMAEPAGFELPESSYKLVNYLI